MLVLPFTAQGQEIDRDRGMKAGAIKYMTKPFDPDDILDLAKEILFGA